MLRWSLCIVLLFLRIALLVLHLHVLLMICHQLLLPIRFHLMHGVYITLQLLLLYQFLFIQDSLMYVLHLFFYPLDFEVAEIFQSSDKPRMVEQVCD